MAMVSGLAGELSCVCVEANTYSENEWPGRELPAVSPAELLGYFRYVISK